MKCQHCSLPATQHITELENGEYVEYHVCAEHLNVREPYKDEECRGIARGFSTFHDPGAREKFAAYLLPALCLALSDDQPNVRCMAAWIIRLVGRNAKSARAALRDRLADPDENVREVVALALQAIDK